MDDPQITALSNEFASPLAAHQNRSLLRVNAKIFHINQQHTFESRIRTVKFQSKSSLAH